MKKNLKVRQYISPHLKKLLRIMRVIFVLVFVLTLQMSASVYSQQTRLSLNLTGVTIRQALNQIEEQSKYKFLLQSERLDIDRKINIHADQESIGNILNEIFANQGINYVITEKNLIIINPSGQENMNAGETQQLRIVSGIVKDSSGSPLPGVTVVIKGTTQGTITNVTGNYTLSKVSGDAMLVFSFVGMKTQEIAVGNSTNINVVMEEEITAVEEVVVTAFGVTRQKKALGYSITQVGSEDIERTRDNNVINTLSGKVAGIQITRNASGAAGTSRVVIRGNKSLSGNNTPLYVVDGVPIDNTQFGEAGRYGGIDQGDGLSTLNPADIESISILKGPNAAALYGSRAANGVILITTKTGKARKGIGVTLNVSHTWDSALLFPDLQNSYGQGSNGTLPEGDDDIPYTSTSVDGSWGPKMEGQQVRDWTGNVQAFSPQPDNMKDFYQTGHTNSATVALSGGNEKINSRFSFTNDDVMGIQPTNYVGRQALNLRTTTKLSDKLSSDVKVTYTDQSVINRPQMSDMQGNPAYNLTVMPRNIRTADAENYMTSTGVENLWTSDTYKGNPYWTINKQRTSDKLQRITGFASLHYDFTDWLNLMIRAGIDKYDRKYLYYRAKGTRVYPNGNLTQEKRTMQEVNTDFLLTAKKDIGQDFSMSISAGGNIYDQKYNYITQSGTQFKVPDFYHISNLVNYSTGYYEQHKQIRSLYGMGQISFRNYFFVDLTARNDWSSTLPAGNNSYFYPSVTSSFILTDAFADAFNPDILSFCKFRASWARVGNDTAPYSTLIYYSFNADSYNGQPTATLSSTTIPAVDLKPELTSSWEFGTDLRLFNNRAGIDFTYYSQETKNQILDASISRASGAYVRKMNAGKIKNNGFEVLLTLSPVKSTSFSWDVSLNFAKNNSEVVELMEGINTYLLGADRLVSVECRPGGPYGNLYGAKWLRDDKGNRMVNSDGIPLYDGTTSNYQLIGNFNPDWTGGISNTLTYKGLSLYALLDVRMGGEFLSLSKYYMAAYGTSVETLEGRAAWYASEAARESAGKTSDEWTPTGGYLVDGVIAELSGSQYVSTGQKNNIYINPEDYFGRGIGEEYIQDASFVKLREVAVNYEIPKRWLSKTPVQTASISLIGRNLFFLYRESKDYDPESTYTSTNYGAGVESHAMPTTKNLGFSIKMTF
ncbi:MAG: SusC/RagA family TonB-linked outer membrane protein [Mangrovibacterium sp.]